MISKKEKIKQCRALIDEYQLEHGSEVVYNDPRGLMSAIDMACSLMRKEIVRMGFISSGYPKILKSDHDFNMLCNRVSAILKGKEQKQ